MEDTVPYLPISKFDEIYEKTININKEDPNNLQRSLVTNGITLHLEGMSMEKYAELFLAHNIGLDVFFNLRDEDLSAIGILDKKDREIILKKLSPISDSSPNLYPPESALEDLAIARHSLKETIILSSYLRCMLARLRKTDLQDFSVSEKVKASELLKLTLNKSIQQTELIREEICSVSKQNGLIFSIAKKKNLHLPDKMFQIMNKWKRFSRRKLVLVVLSATGMCSLATLVFHIFYK